VEDHTQKIPKIHVKISLLEDSAKEIYSDTTGDSAPSSCPDNSKRR
jgi:hypothetical protein